MKRYTPSSNIKNTDVSFIISNLAKSIGGVEVREDLGFEKAEGYDFIKGYDIDEAIDDTFDLFTKYSALTGDFKDFSFTADYTYATVTADEGNLLRYHIVKRTPATQEQGQEPHEGRKQVKWILADLMDDKENPGYKVLVYYKPFDNTIELTSWSKNYRDTNRGADLIENVMESYGYLLKLKGLQNLRFMGRGIDQLREFGTFSIYGAFLRYYYRTYQIKLVYEKTLEELILETVIHK